MKKFETEPNDLNYEKSKNTIRQEGMREQLDWIRRQLEYSSFSEKYVLRYDLKRGEIYEFDWGLNVNAEFSSRHFGVVLVDSDIFNPLVTVCPLKSYRGSFNPKSDLDLGYVAALPNNRKTIAVINQIKTIDKLRLYTKRIIGFKKEELNEEQFENETNYMRLENSKLFQIIDAYANYIYDGKIKM